MPGLLGMTPMAGRMRGWLLICDPPEQTAAELADALQASRGAISGAADPLERGLHPTLDAARRPPRVLLARRRRRSTVPAQRRTGLRASAS